MPPNQNQTRSKARRGPPRPTTARGPYAGLAISLVLHAGLMVGTYITWQHMTQDVAEESHAVPVDLITVAPQTNVAAQAPPPEKVEIPKPILDAPPLPQFTELEPAPEPPKPQFTVKSSDSDDSNDGKTAAKNFAAMLNQLATPAPPPKNAKLASRTVQGVGAQTQMTASLGDSLKSQIYQCWSPPVGAPNAADLVVSFDLRLNRNGTVAFLGMTAETTDRALNNAYTRAAADAASRAIYQCQHSGFKLPPERWNEWSEINPLRFDPREMMNQ